MWLTLACMVGDISKRLKSIEAELMYIETRQKYIINKIDCEEEKEKR